MTRLELASTVSHSHVSRPLRFHLACVLLNTFQMLPALDCFQGQLPLSDQDTDFRKVWKNTHVKSRRVLLEVEPLCVSPHCHAWLNLGRATIAPGWYGILHHGSG